MHQLKVQHQLPLDIDQAWDFFSSPKNLSKITPPDMRFRIIGVAPDNTYAGQIICYKVSPLLRIPIRWVTEITHVEEGKFFVDEQRFGPYSMWHHEHFFEENKDGVLMTDIVSYKLPAGVLGRALNSLFVRKKVKGIFEHRRTRLDELFKM